MNAAKEVILIVTAVFVLLGLSGVLVVACDSREDRRRTERNQACERRVCDVGNARLLEGQCYCVAGVAR
jgi:hypothetical protein